MALAISLLLLAVYTSNGDFARTGDALSNTYLPVSLLNERDLSFTPSEMPFMFVWGAPVQTEFRDEKETVGQKWLVQGCLYYICPTQRFDGKTGERQYVSIYGPAAGLAALPVIAVLHAVLGDLRDHVKALSYGAKFAASCYVAASAGLLYLAVRRWLNWRWAVLLTLTYGLGTCVWSISSQTLWQHGPCHFFMALGLWAWVRLADSPRRYAALLGFAISCAVACRPAVLLVVPVFALFLLWEQRRALWPYLLAGLPVAVALALYNQWYLGSPFAFGQEQAAPAIALEKTGVEAAWVSPFRLGTLGLFFSPSRGLFVFSPVLLFALPGFVIPWYRRDLLPLRAVGVCVLAIWGLYAVRSEWWGGWGYGYRFLNDSSGPLAMLLVPVVPWLRRRLVHLALFATLFIWSVAVQFVGAYAYEEGSWEARVAWCEQVAGGERMLVDLNLDQVVQLKLDSPERNIEQVKMDIDNPAFRYRLWSWSDSEILFCLERFSAERLKKKQGLETHLRHFSRGARLPD